MSLAQNTLNHLAIIMDGNSRWAMANNLNRNLGHKQGAQKAKMVIEWAGTIGIKYLSLFIEFLLVVTFMIMVAVMYVLNYDTNQIIIYLSLFAFSTENWSRPSFEVQYLLNLLDWYLNNELVSLVKNGVKLQIIGDLETLTPEMRTKIKNLNNLTPQQTNINVYIAFSYGGQKELVDAVKRAIEQGLRSEDISQETFSQLLYAPEMPPIDLLIRTGGNQRMSNFFLWHTAYAELCFIEKYWPDFAECDLQEAVERYKDCQRTFGMRK